MGVSVHEIMILLDEDFRLFFFVDLLGFGTIFFSWNLDVDILRANFLSFKNHTYLSTFIS